MPEPDDLPGDDPLARLLERARQAMADDEALDALMDGLDERPDLAREMARVLRRHLDERGAGSADAA